MQRVNSKSNKISSAVRAFRAQDRRPAPLALHSTTPANAVITRPSSDTCCSQQVETRSDWAERNRNKGEREREE